MINPTDKEESPSASYVISGEGNAISVRYEQAMRMADYQKNCSCKLKTAVLCV